MAKSRRTGTLTPDDEQVWSHVTSSVHPLRRAERGSRRSTDSAEAMEAIADTARDDVAMPDLSVLGLVSSGKPRWQTLTPSVPPRPKPTAATQAFDKRHAKKIATGRIEIEGRIDLHGLRESEAHVRLRGFLRQAQAQGKRTVLVITGKGQETDDPHTPFDFGHERSPRGVLKRNVPRWLAEPDLAPLVVSFTTAHTRHGGEGALYVHLRRA